MERGSHLCCLCSKLTFFKRSSKSFMLIKQAKKACIRPCDTNNFSQSLIKKYHHTATESLYRLCDEKYVGHPPKSHPKVRKIRLLAFWQKSYPFTLESGIIVPPPPPPPPIVNFLIFFHLRHLYSNPPIINFQSFLLTFLSVNSHFHHSLL